MCCRARSQLLLIAALVSALVVALTGCALPANQTSSNTPATCTSATGPACAVGSGAMNLQLFIEPDDGVRPVTDAMRAAHHSIWVEVYLLTDTAVINALEDAANRGLDVRVMLEPRPFGPSPFEVQQTMEKLKIAGIKISETSPAFQLTHAKVMLIDGSALFIMTGNLTKSVLGGYKEGANRDFILKDTEVQDIQEVQNIFTADWNRRTPMLSDANLIVSPVNSRAKLLALINSAQSSLHIENEEMQDQQIEDALAQAARRGVNVEVVLPISSGSSDSNAAGVAFLRQANISVRKDKQLYIHAKLMLVDGARAYVGSENFSAASLDLNRELGLIVAAPDIIQSLETTFMTDYATSA